LKPCGNSTSAQKQNSLIIYCPSWGWNKLCLHPEVTQMNGPESKPKKNDNSSRKPCKKRRLTAESRTGDRHIAEGLTRPVSTSGMWLTSIS
jgi:hypothetical protein